MRQITLLLALTATLAACGGGDDDDDVTTGFDDAQIIDDFADDVVIATYGLLADRADALAAAVDDLAADPSQANLDAAQAAWVATRQPWEQSEGFLFGPVSAFGYDPAMDSWPVNKTDLDAVLASGDELTSEYVRNLQETQKGFHTIEYLLFGELNGKTADQVTARELEYLVAITAELVATTHALEESWTSGVQGQAAYREIFTSAGEEGNTAYPSRSSAAQEILAGMSGICDEVANGKIADPYDAHDPELVESQFSFNSQLDFADNIRSVENAYNGRTPAAGTSGRGLTVFVAALDPDLDARVKSEIAAAIEAIGAIPEPFRDAITNPEAYDEIEAAQEAVRSLQRTIDEDVLPLVQ